MQNAKCKIAAGCARSRQCKMQNAKLQQAALGAGNALRTLPGFGFCILHFALVSLGFGFCILHFALASLGFGFCILHFAFCILHLDTYA